MDPIRRKILKTGAAATAMAAAPRAFAQQPRQGGTTMSFYEKGPVRIHYEETGSGFPLLLIAGGGLNSTISGLARGPFDPIKEFKGEYRSIASDLRNANDGQSSGPLEIDRPWDSYTDDHLGLMDHLRIDKFMVMGFCIGGPFIWNLLKRAPNRVVAAVLAQPSGFRPEMPTLFYDNNMTGWGPALVARRPEITMAMVEKFLTKMYRTNPDFVFTVTRDFVRTCQTPVLILPDDIPAHPYAVAMEAAMLAPKAEVSMFPWKEPKERIPLAIRQIFANLMSICVRRLSAYSRWSLSRTEIFVLPVASPPGGSRPMTLWIRVFGTAQVAVSGSAGCDRTVPLTSTSIFGSVYDAS